MTSEIRQICAPYGAFPGNSKFKSRINGWSDIGFGTIYWDAFGNAKKATIELSQLQTAS
jgi:hypothetical protein